MARADREAVLRGVNARFDETGDDDAVIAALGSPTFAAVSVLRGYTPPEDSDGEGSYYEEEEYQYAEPASGSGEAEADSPAEPVEEAPDTAEEAASDVEAPQEAPAGDAPEAEAGAMDEPSPGQAPPEAEPEAPESTEPEEPETASEPESDAGAGLEPEEPSAEPEPEIEQPEPVEGSVPEFETVDIGLGTIEVYSDGSAGAQEPVSEDEVPAEETPAEEESVEEPAEPEPEPDESAEAEPEPDADYGYTSESDYEYPQPPEAEPERAKLRGGRVFACVLLGIIPGIPVTVILILASLALLLIGASLAYAGGVAISFAFLGMSVVADILLCVGFGLMVGAVGLVIVFLAVWFFLRCVAGLCSRVFAKAGAWCRWEVRE